jgi:hypothetical protein
MSENGSAGSRQLEGCCWWLCKVWSTLHWQLQLILSQPFLLSELYAMFRTRPCSYCKSRCMSHWQSGRQLMCVLLHGFYMSMSSSMLLQHGHTDNTWVSDYDTLTIEEFAVLKFWSYRRHSGRRVTASTKVSSISSDPFSFQASNIFCFYISTRIFTSFFSCKLWV